MIGCRASEDEAGPGLRPGHRRAYGGAMAVTVTRATTS